MGFFKVRRHQTQGVLKYAIDQVEEASKDAPLSVRLMSVDLSQSLNLLRTDIAKSAFVFYAGNAQQRHRLESMFIDVFADDSGIDFEQSTNIIHIGGIVMPKDQPGEVVSTPEIVENPTNVIAIIKADPDGPPEDNYMAYVSTDDGASWVHIPLNRLTSISQTGPEINSLRLKVVIPVEGSLIAWALGWS